MEKEVSKDRRESLEKVLVVGAGFMGSGIAQVSAQAGYQVHLVDIQTAITDRALKNIRWSVESWRQKAFSRKLRRKCLPEFRRRRIYPVPPKRIG
jgi:3-hydroxyacyl-CoA dehydrogenase